MRGTVAIRQPPGASMSTPGHIPGAPLVGGRPAGAWSFRPSWWGGLMVAVLVPLFVALGNWQWDKAERKSALQERLDSLARDVPVALPITALGDPADYHFRRVTLSGHYDAAGQILLDNQMLHERAGWQVLTPLVQSGSRQRVLINRGWLPAGDRTTTATLAPPPHGLVTLTGTAVVPSQRFFSLAPDTAAAGHNALWQHLDLARYRAESRTPVAPVVVRLDAGDGDGLIRDWPRPDERHARHRSYALQWYGFALAAVAIWLWRAFRQDPV